MAQLSQLLARLPEGKDVHMSTMGHVLWVCWHNNLTPAVNQTLLNYGGMLVGEERDGVDQRVLAAALDAGPVHEFAVVRPSLSDLYRDVVSNEEKIVATSGPVSA